MKNFALFLIVSLFVFNITFITTPKVEAQTSSGCIPPLQLKNTGSGPVCQMVYTDVSQLLPGCAPDVTGSTVESRLAYANDVRSVECQPQSGYSVALPGDYDPVTGTFRCPDQYTHVNIGWIRISENPDVFKWNGGCGAFSSTLDTPLPQPNGPTPGQVDADRCASTASLASGATVYTGTTSAGALTAMDVNLNGREACIAYAGMRSCSIDTNNPAFDPKFNPATCCQYGVDPNIQAGGIITGCGGSVGGSTGNSTKVPCGPGDSFNYLTGKSCFGSGAGAVIPGGTAGSAGGGTVGVPPSVSGSTDSTPGSAGGASTAASYSTVWGDQVYKVYVVTPGHPATPLSGETLLYSFDSGGNTYKIYGTTGGSSQVVTTPSAGSAGAITVAPATDGNIIFGVDAVIFSSKFGPGQRVKTNTNTNVRSSAFISGVLLGTQASGSVGTIVSGGTSFDGHYWWQVNYDNGVDGWSAENFLDASSSPSQSVVTTPGSSTSNNTFLSTSNNFTVGQKVQTVSVLNVRSKGDSSATLLGSQAKGSLGTISSNKVLGNDGLYWWEVNYDNGVDGWSWDLYLSPAN